MNHELDAALQLHQAGRFADAARAYHGVLVRDPDDADALHLFGVLHHQNGYSDRAVELIRRAVALRPGNAVYHANLAEAFRAQGEHARAADACREALRLRPDHPEALNNLGLALQGLGNHAEAIQVFEAAITSKPDFATAQNNRANSLRELGRIDEAIDAFQSALEIDPDLGLAHANLGQMLIDRGGLDEGLSHCLSAVRTRPDLPAAHNNLGNAYRALGHWADAVIAYQEAVRLDPSLRRAQANLGLALQHVGKVVLAIPHFRKAVELMPGDVEMLTLLAAAHGENDDWPAALLCCEQILELAPDRARSHSDYGWALQEEGRLTEAEAGYRTGLERFPDQLDLLLNLGGLLEEKGDLAGAEATYRAASAAHPKAAGPLFRLATLLRAKLSDEDRRAAAALLAEPALDDGGRSAILFGLAHALDGRGQFDEAAANLRTANVLARDLNQKCGRLYSAGDHKEFVDRLVTAFSPALFQRLAGAGSNTQTPVFVVGLPRSGTTLVEQVLASHPQILGAGELRIVPALFNAIPDYVGHADDIPKAVDVLDPATIEALARRHAEALQAVVTRSASTAPARVVDKMPDNYLYLGLLALLVPRATVIYVRRDPRDIALSCWMTSFRNIRWANDPEQIAARFREHQRIMAHWRKVLPTRFHEIHYEQLVENFEPKARRLLDACGVGWDPGCLEFHRTNRPVRTASITQVRQPLYRRSVERWRSYEPYLGELFAKLPEGDDTAG